MYAPAAQHQHHHAHLFKGSYFVHCAQHCRVQRVILLAGGDHCKTVQVLSATWLLGLKCENPL